MHAGSEPLLFLLCASPPTTTRATLPHPRTEIYHLARALMIDLSAVPVPEWQYGRPVDGERWVTLTALANDARTPVAPRMHSSVSCPLPRLSPSRIHRHTGHPPAIHSVHSIPSRTGASRFPHTRTRTPRSLEPPFAVINRPPTSFAPHITHAHTDNFFPQQQQQQWASSARHTSPPSSARHGRSSTAPWVSEDRDGHGRTQH